MPFLRAAVVSFMDAAHKQVAPEASRSPQPALPQPRPDARSSQGDGQAHDPDVVARDRLKRTITDDAAHAD